MARTTAGDFRREVRRPKSHVAVWRDAIRDSDLERTAKLVAHTLSTYMNAAGAAWPSRQTLARGSSISDRAVDSALTKIVSAGFLLITRSDGGRSHTNRYAALIPETANALRHSEWETANGVQETANGTTRNGERRSPESRFESNGKPPRPFSQCTKCHKTAALNEFEDYLVCDECLIKLTPPF